MRDATLREAMISQLERTGTLRLPRIAAAMRVVPRHRFLPGTPLDEAYADRAIAIKTRADEVLSSISQPGMIAQMLELLSPAPGERVLEIGTGSGYNAALLAELVGPAGTVTTVELDPDLATRARETLEELGYRNVRVVAGDGSRDVLHAEQYDCLVVTARTDDVADAWWQAVGEGARMVVPLRLESAGEYAIGFVRRGNRLESIGAHPCAFIALRGDASAHAPSDVFFRDPAARTGLTCLRRISSVLAVRREDATPALLDGADVVVARPVTLFAVTFT
jgi:protein-L-isoaspartate(D-aspartate) O-methyltransferase